MDAGKHRVGQPIPAPDLAEFLHVQCAPLRAEQAAVQKARAYIGAQRAVLEQQRDRNRRIEKRVAEQTRAHFREPTPIYDALRSDTA